MMSIEGSLSTRRTLVRGMIEQISDRACSMLDFHVYHIEGHADTDRQLAMCHAQFENIEALMPEIDFVEYCMCTMQEGLEFIDDEMSDLFNELLVWSNKTHTRIRSHLDMMIRSAIIQRPPKKDGNVNVGNCALCCRDRRASQRQQCTGCHTSMCKTCITKCKHTCPYCFKEIENVSPCRGIFS